MDRTDLPKEAVSIDGQYIEDVLPGYTTVLTSGREGLTAELNTYSVGAADGETLKGTRYPARQIKVDFVLKADSLEMLRAKMNHLNNLLSAEDADFIFNDEPDMFFTGTIIVNNEFSPYWNALKGSYTIYCAYPFKRSVEPIELCSTDLTGVTVADHSATFTFYYNGNHPGRPVLRAEFAGAKSGGDHTEDGDCGFVAWMDSDENIIQLGNPDAVDLDDYTSAQTLINREFTTISGWTASGISTKSISDPYWNSGKGLSKTFASGTGTLQKDTTGASNFDVAIVQRICVNSASQTGSFECGLINTSSSKVVTGYRIKKTANGTLGTVEYVVNGSVVGKDNIDLSYNNTNFGYCGRTAVYKTQYYDKKKKKWQDKKIKKAKTRQAVSGYNYTQSNLNSSIKKAGSAVTFKVGNLSARTFNNSDIEQTVAQRLKFTFSGSLNTNAVQSVRFTQDPSASFKDIPNVFLSGDVVEADCNDATVTLMRSGTVEGHLEPQYGALGNDWEDFVLTKGLNTITAVWSTWLDPAYKPTIYITYNEVFL